MKEPIVYSSPSPSGFSSSESISRVLPAKLAPPISAPSHLQRQKLLKPMIDAGPTKLVLIRAAAGFGKSTLMQQYHAHCLASGRPAIWFNLDIADNDLQRFVRHLNIGFERLSMGEQEAQTPHQEQHSLSELSLDLLDRIAAAPTPFSLLLDEFEVLQNPQVLNFIQQLIEALPAGSLLVITSRSAPDIGLGRIRARGQLVEIGPSALRFSLDEATVFIREKHELELRDNEIATLHRCTEGWAAAIFLASLSLHERTDYAAFVSSFSGSNLELAEYLAEDILARQSEECRLFLLQTSVLSRLCAPLCDFITGRDDSQAMIEYLEKANLFLFPLDNERSWFRYHSLFASFLGDALNRQYPGHAETLHRAAAQWYLSVNRPVPAIEHLLRANATAEAAVQIAAHVTELMDAGRSRLLLRWLDQIPESELNDHPNLLVAYAWTLVIGRRYQEVALILQRLKVYEADGERQGYALEAETVRCLLLVMTEQVEECCIAGPKQLDRLPPDDMFQYGVVTNSLAFSLIATSKYDEARSLLSRALQRPIYRRSAYMRSMAGCMEGILDLVQGRLGNALARLHTAAERHYGDTAGEAIGGRSSIIVILAMALYEADELGETEQSLLDILPYAKDNSTPDQLIASHILLSRMAHLRGDKDQWLRYLAELEQLGHQISSSRVVCSAWLERARIATLEGRPDAAAQALRSAELMSDWERPGVSMYATDVDLPSIVRWRLRISQGDCKEPAAELEQAIQQAQSTQHHRRALKLRVLRALALTGAGALPAAFDELTQALRFASHEGFRRTFLDEGHAMTELLKLWAATHQGKNLPTGIEPRFLAELLERISKVDNSAAVQAGLEQDTNGSREALTAREIQVIRLLAEGHRNRVIAEKMFLSEFTVKSHLRNINSKLGAQGRTEAVAIARTRGLID
ncbi:LuxR C-terminal-related transcriptional regulator [Pseudomonas sp. LS44]|uniref:LuxR C-terminal-related transcriptional regulator n=1 Tax=Pseudomonas sp. LS44 TaxID=1357074 RepID=UPI00215AAC9D|nr:LuxR C-terminal-related transcriptional regulator [Pseudomonas sp. LS44]UVE18710.1 LuxR C-terminal-related transcriptional regulator [Pseudomonas sp. LS44]